MGILNPEVPFSYEFALRTLHNYFRVKKMETQIRRVSNSDISEDNKKYEKLEKDIEQRLNDHRCIIDEFYEVTFILNTLLGIFVLPKAQLKTISMNISWDDIPELTELMKDKENYENTYNYETGSPYDILMHIRNAICHEHIGFYPLPSERSNSSIAYIVFQDTFLYYEKLDPKTHHVKRSIQVWETRRLEHKYNAQPNYDVSEYRPVAPNVTYSYFRLRVPVDNLEKLFLSLCNKMIEKFT